MNRGETTRVLLFVSGMLQSAFMKHCNFSANDKVILETKSQR